MKQRILTAVLLAPLAVAAVLWAPTTAVLVLLGGVLLLGLWEWLRLVGVAHRGARAGVLAAHALAMLALGWLGGPLSWTAVTLAGLLWWAVAALWLTVPRLGGGRGGQVSKLAAAVLMFLPCWCAVALLHGDGALGPRWTLFGLLLVWAADTFAYFAGSRIGGPRLAPEISPGKTWAGLVGGLLGALLLCLPALPLLGLAWSQLPFLLGLALLTALLSVVGDLFESLVKRHAGAKDSGNLIPGHGGVMDRIDGVVAALPVFVIGKAALGL